MATPRKPGAKRGRPSDYTAAHAKRAYRLILLGLTDEQIADAFGVTRATLNAWKRAHPEFLDTVTRAKVEADSQVAEAMFKRALGYSHRSEEIFCTKYGEIVRARTIKHYPPETKAATVWLFNRQRALWRNHVEVEHTDKRPLEDLTDEQLEEAAGIRRARDPDRASDPAGAKEPDSVH